MTQVRGMLVDLLPARAGSLSYLVLLNRRLGVAADRAVASFYAAFLLDLAALGILLAICAWAAISARSGDAPRRRRWWSPRQRSQLRRGRCCGRRLHCCAGEPRDSSTGRVRARQAIPRHRRPGASRVRSLG